MKLINKVVSEFKESIFSTMTALANENKAINLAQGFPDFEGPLWIIEYAKKALDKGTLENNLGCNQYAPSMGILPLREVISANYKKFYGLNYNPVSEILVTNGATEAIFCTIMALINPGDEVVVFEPFYDSYLANLKLAGAHVKTVTLKLNQDTKTFFFDNEEVKNVVTKNTKLLILNTPNNPTGKVFSKDELEFLGKLAIENDFYILSDEVYEFLTFEKEHTPIATLSNLFERTITISSTGKTFGLTGWKVGWCAGPMHLIKAIHNVHQFNTFCVAHPLQMATSEALLNLENYLPLFKSDYARKKTILMEGLKKLGMEVLNPEGTYFLLVLLKDDLEDVEYCKKLILENKVALIPASAFYLNSNDGKKLIRFCFAKKEETLKSAILNLSKV